MVAQTMDMRGSKLSRSCIKSDILPTALVNGATMRPNTALVTTNSKGHPISMYMFDAPDAATAIRVHRRLNNLTKMSLGKKAGCFLLEGEAVPDDIPFKVIPPEEVERLVERERVMAKSAIQELFPNTKQ